MHLTRIFDIYIIESRYTSSKASTTIARVNAKTILVTQDLMKIEEYSYNPLIDSILFYIYLYSRKNRERDNSTRD
jgi:tRNA U34 5-carboxymethylaminomethyl modifying enzyme MnmG/GidA